MLVARLLAQATAPVTHNQPNLDCTCARNVSPPLRVQLQLPFRALEQDLSTMPSFSRPRDHSCVLPCAPEFNARRMHAGDRERVVGAGHAIMCERGGHSVCGACLSCTGAAAAASSCGRASPHPPRKILPRARAHTDCTSHAEGEEETTWYAQLRSLVDLKHANIVHALDLRASDAGEVVLVRQHGDGEREGESVCARTAASASGNSAASRTTSVNAGHARPLCPSTPPDPKLHRRAAAAAGPQPGPRPRWHHDNTRRHAQGAAAAARAGKAHLDLGPQGIFRWIVQHLAGRQRVQRPEQHGDASRRGRKRSYRVLFVIKTPSQGKEYGTNVVLF